jgi:hypothetical protein
MKEKLDGGPAFPVSAPGLKMIGMTLRDYFAAKAMQAIANERFNAEFLAEYAYKIADAMLDEREKP